MFRGVGVAAPALRCIWGSHVGGWRTQIMCSARLFGRWSCGLAGRLDGWQCLLSSRGHRMLYAHGPRSVVGNLPGHRTTPLSAGRSRMLICDLVSWSLWYKPLASAKIKCHQHVLLERSGCADGRYDYRATCEGKRS
jgi:hypothetical protein